MLRLAWSNGTKPQRSARPESGAPPERPVLDTQDTKTEMTEEAPSWATRPATPFALAPHTDYGGTFRDAGHREEACARVCEREPIERMVRNPFLSGATYLDHLGDQEQYLRPQVGGDGGMAFPMHR